MWHLRTPLGVFWVVPGHNTTFGQYYLGINHEELGCYPNAEKAAHDVYNQVTGYLKWDTASRVSVPEHITDWVEGEPMNWNKKLSN